MNQNKNVDNEFLSEYGLISPDGKWYNCEFGEHAAIASRIVREKQEEFHLTDSQMLDMVCGCDGEALDYLYRRGWIVVHNPSLGKPFLDMDETKRATNAQMNVVSDYIGHFIRYGMDVSKIID